jgi:hypothetical protein
MANRLWFRETDWRAVGMLQEKTVRKAFEATPKLEKISDVTALIRRGRGHLLPDHHVS